MNAASNDEGVNAKGNGNNVTSKVYLRQMTNAEDAEGIAKGCSR